MNTSYVTYDASGKLNGSFLQAIQPEHEAAHIIVTDAQRLAWVNYQANAARDDIELAPVVTPQPTIPQSISRRQALQALYLRAPSIAVADIEAAINSHLTGSAQGLALIELRESQVFERQRPLIISMGAVLGLSSAEMDALFIHGDTL
ncbi:MAG: hypothetical protein JWQ01_4895 [Massilia sp.]|jgi:hypothetical protein|nr:hypothetical protein [Massilia sp.]